MVYFLYFQEELIWKYNEELKKKEQIITNQNLAISKIKAFF